MAICCAVMAADETIDPPVIAVRRRKTTLHPAGAPVRGSAPPNAGCSPEACTRHPGRSPRSRCAAGSSAMRRCTSSSRGRSCGPCRNASRQTNPSRSCGAHSCPGLLMRHHLRSALDGQAVNCAPRSRGVKFQVAGLWPACEPQPCSEAALRGGFGPSAASVEHVNSPTLPVISRSYVDTEFHGSLNSPVVNFADSNESLRVSFWVNSLLAIPIIRSTSAHRPCALSSVQSALHVDAKPKRVSRFIRIFARQITTIAPLYIKPCMPLPRARHTSGRANVEAKMRQNSMPHLRSIDTRNRKNHRSFRFCPV